MATAPTGQNNLLSKPELSEISNAHLASKLYVVYDNKDYQATLAALLSLVTKESVGLGNVDNTSDQDKPISQKTQQALAQKADIESTATKQELEALAQELEDLVSIETLNQAISSLSQAISQKVDGQQLSNAIANAVSPINQAIAGIQDRLSSIEQTLSGGVVSEQQLNTAVSSLEQLIAQVNSQQNQSKATKTELSQGLDQLRTELNQSISSLSNSTTQNFASVQQSISSLQTTIGQMAIELNEKLDKENFLTPDVIDVINQAVQDEIGDGVGFVRVGDAQW